MVQQLRLGNSGAFSKGAPREAVGVSGRPRLLQECYVGGASATSVYERFCILASAVGRDCQDTVSSSFPSQSGEWSDGLTVVTE